MTYLRGTFIGEFTGGPLDGETLIVPTQDGALPDKMTFASYENDGKVLVRPMQEFEARWAQYVYQLGVVGDGTAAYTFVT